MQKIIITHGVEDIARWKGHDAERIENLGAFATDIASYVAGNGSASVAVAMTVTDWEGLQAFMQSDACAALMQRHGVVQPVTMLSAS